VVPYSAYDPFAWYYRLGWGDEFHINARPVIERHVFPRLPEHARILDLCCGSGDLSAFLTHRGYIVTGIDGSAEMLRFAREKVPAAMFLHHDARSFDLPAEFDAVLSTFDSLNHILELDELEQVFRNAYRALRPNGLIFFDLNMEEAFEDQWRGTWGAVEETSVGLTRGTYDPRRRLGRADVTVFRKEDNGMWSRTDVSVYERCYSEEEVIGALERAGFVDIQARDAAELGMKELASGREFFFGTK
jgi:SAM-dependent methyltransferase